jgi:predicted transcriptional regulator
MEPITLRIPTDTLRTLEEIADEREASVSAVARENVEKGLAYDDLEAENERLQRRVETLIAMNEEHGELVEYVSQERSIQKQRAERQNAPIWKRGYWWVFGRGEQDALSDE